MREVGRDGMLAEVLRNLLRIEAGMARRIEAALPRVQQHAVARDVLETLFKAVETQASALHAELDRRGATEDVQRSDQKESHEAARAPMLGDVSSALLEVVAEACKAVLSYTALATAAFRVYDPPLRKLAPAHLKAYVGAVRAIERLMPSVTVLELLERGFECECICPMCSLGACGCLAVGAETLDEAVAETAPQAAPADGFALTRPRPGSQLDAAGVQEGDVVLAVDGAPVQRYVDIQRAIRKHPLGDNVRFTVQTRVGPQEFVVRHVRDYPS